MSLDKVRWLAYVHPVAWQFELVELLLCRHCGENFSLNRGWAVLNAVDDVEVEQVETRVDLVADKDLGLLHEAFNLTILLSDDDAIACWVLYLCHHNGALAAVVPVEFNQLA